MQKQVPDKRRISNKTTLTLTLSRPTGEGTACLAFRRFQSGWTIRATEDHSPSSIRWVCVFSVAQSCTRPYRRFVICVASQRANAWDWSDTLPNIIRRYGRLKICVTRRATALNRYRWERAGVRVMVSQNPKLFWLGSQARIGQCRLPT